MIPTIAVALMLCAVAGCCIYISYSIGQSISPASRVIERRLAHVEAGFARSEARVGQALEHHRQASSEETVRLLGESAKALESRVDSLRRPIDDLHDRLNGMRLDLTRESRDAREDLENAVRTMRDGTREYLGELARTQAETTEQLAGRLQELDAADERRHEGARVSLERTAAELKGAHAAGVAEVRATLAAHMMEVQEAAAGICRRIVEHGAQLARTDEELKAARRASEQQFDALRRAVDNSLEALRVHANEELEKLHATSNQQGGMWREIKHDFDSLSRSLVNIKRAIDVVRNQLTIPLRDADAHTNIKAVLERALQPDEFERDVEVEPGAGRRIEFAVRLSDNPLTKVWLPVAVLSAVDGYHELVASGVYGDAEQLNGSVRAFDTCVLAAAQDLNEKFVAPPHTMNLAVLFVPTDDIYGEIARRDTLVETLRRDFHVIAAGPATLPPLVRALREAFRGTQPSTVKANNGSALGNGGEVADSL
jgi:DNA recombination protein RmuC